MGYLPTKENPFSPGTDGKEKTEPFDKEEDGIKLPIVDKIKVSSTGEDRRTKQKTNLKKGDTSGKDLNAFPVLPSDTADQEPAFFSGYRNLSPTEQETTVSKSETAASETEGKLSKDGVSGQDGSIKASETEAKAATGEATAAESGAQALRTTAGASDIETKALKIT